MWNPFLAKSTHLLIREPLPDGCPNQGYHPYNPGPAKAQVQQKYRAASQVPALPGYKRRQEIYKQYQQT